MDGKNWTGKWPELRYNTDHAQTLPAQFKAQGVQEILKEEQTLKQLAAEHSVHPNQLKLGEVRAIWLDAGPKRGIQATARLAFRAIAPGQLGQNLARGNAAVAAA